MNPVDEFRRFIMARTGLPGDPAEKVRAVSCSPELYEAVCMVLRGLKLYGLEVKSSPFLQPGTVIGFDRRGSRLVLVTEQEVVHYRPDE